MWESGVRLEFTQLPIDSFCVFQPFRSQMFADPIGGFRFVVIREDEVFVGPDVREARITVLHDFGGTGRSERVCVESRWFQSSWCVGGHRELNSWLEKI